jgi:type IV pilus assembly protein PilV
MWKPNERPRVSGAERGLSLIEVLIALVVVSVGLLGMAGLQAYSIKNNNSAYHRSQANTLAYDLLDCARTDRDAWLEGRYHCLTNGTGKALSCPSGQTPNERAARDLANWKVNLERLLPSGAGAIDCDMSNPVCTVTVQWADTRGLEPIQQLIVSTRL